MGVLKVKDPTTGVWLDIAGGVGATGPVGPVGPEGPQGPVGPEGPPADEVIISNSAPDPVTSPDVDLWYDPDAVSKINIVPFPTGGTTGQALAKTTDTDGDVSWQGPHLKLTGGTVTGSLTVTGNAQVDGELTAPTVNGNVHFANNISANKVTDRTAYTWERLDLRPLLTGDWEGGASGFPGPCDAYRNRYCITLVIAAHRKSGGYPEDSWVDVITPGSLPAEWRPAYDLWQTAQGVETDETGSTFETRLTNTGSIQVQMKGLSLDWQSDTRIPIYYSYPRAA